MSTVNESIDTDMAHCYTVKPSGALSGELSVPGDKSISNRALMLAALATGDTEIDGLLDAQDVYSTVDALGNMGVEISNVDENYWIVRGVGLDGLMPPDGPIDCHHCGSTMRLMMGLLAAQPFDSVLTGDDSLLSRTMTHVAEPLRQMGADITLEADGTGPITIKGAQSLQGIKYPLPYGNAQAKSSVLLAALYAKGVTTLIEPFVTRNHTERLLEQFGYDVQTMRPCISLSGGAALKGAHLKIPGDISSAAYFMVAASIVPGSDVLLRNVGFNETRIGVINILRIMGANITIEREDMLGNEWVADIRVKYAKLQGVDIPIDQVPMAIDEFPVLFVAAACATGVTCVREAGELRFKESDRIHTMAAGLRRLGVDLETRQDGIIIQGGNPILGGKVNSHGDPRVAMAFAIAGLVAQESVIVEGCAKVVDIFPNFVELAQQAGIQISLSS